MRQAAVLACPLKLKERRVPIGTRLLERYAVTSHIFVLES